jgi:hypothetical protein
VVRVTSGGIVNLTFSLDELSPPNPHFRVVLQKFLSPSK